MKKLFTLFTSVLALCSMEATAAIVKVDDASKVRMMNTSTYSNLTLTSGENTVDAGSYSVASSDYNYELNKVELNGNAVAASYGYWNVTLADTDTLTITALYDSATYAVTVTAPTGAISKATCGETTVTDFSTSFNAASGYKVELVPNSSAWTINSVKVNGETASYYSGNIQVTVKGATTIEVDATEKATNNFTIKVSDPAAVKAYGAQYSSYYDSNCSITLTDTVNSVSLAQDYTYVAFQKNDGCYITSVTVGSEEIDANYGVYYVPVSNGCTINVVCGAIVKDKTATIVVTDKSAASYGFYFQNADRSSIELNEGENNLQFAASDNPFSLSIYGSDIAPAVYNKGVAVAPYYEGGTSYQFSIADGDYVEVFVKGGESAYGVTGIAEGDYIVKHVTTGKYLGGANAWGTQASVLPHGQIMTVVSSEGKYKLDTHTYNPDANDMHYLGANGYVDAVAAALDIEKVQGGYTISCAAGTYYSVLEGTVVAPDATTADVWEFTTYEKAVEKLAQATAENPMDATFMIKAANFSQRHYNKNYEPAWTIEANNCNICGGSSSNCNAESWKSAFNVYQELKVPNGKYTLSAQAALTDYTNAYDGTDYPVVYANTATSVFNNMEEGDRGTSMGALSTAFSAGKYYIEPITVVVTDSILRVGVKGTRTDTWCVWDNFELTYSGPLAPVIKVDDASKVRVMSQTDYSYLTLADGENEVAAGRYSIQSNVYGYTLNKVFLNGEEVTGSYGYWYVTVNPGDVAEVKALYDSATYAVTLTAPAGSITSVTANGNSVSNFSEPFNAPAGYAVTVTPNTTAWNIKSVKVNGSAVSYYSGSIDVNIVGATTIEIDAEEKVAKQVTIHVSDVNAVKAYGAQYSSYYDSSCPLTLTDTTTVVTLADDYGYVAITKNAGYYITSVTCGETTANEYNGVYYIAVTNGSVVNVVCGEIVKDQTATIVVKDMASANYNFYMQNADRESITLEEGTNTLNFATAYNPFYLGIYGETIAPVIYINGEVKNPAYEGSTSYELTLADGDYVEIFVLGGESQYEATGVESLTTTTEQQIYTLGGSRINAVQKGINIINGRKVLVK